jgi:hypothetical protein
MREQTGRNRKGFMAQLGGGRAGFSLWRGWLWLWLACGMVLPALTQERPDIVWIRGGHTAPSRVRSPAWCFRRMGVCWRRGVRITPSSCGVWRMVRWCAPSRGTQVRLERVVFAGWAFAGVGEFG